MAEQLNRPVGATSRLAYIDHLRVSLVILVILHHVAIVYGAAAPFYYVEPPFMDARAFQTLLVFVMVNQSFFMGALFLLAGYFTAPSFDRKGPAAFARDKAIRLGVPLVVFYFALNAASSAAYYLMPSTITGITTPLTWKAYPDLIGMGPLWFVAMLLVFNLGYLLWRLATGKRRRDDGAPGSRANGSGPGFVGAAVFMVALAGVSYLWRMVIPIGKAVGGYPTLSYLPQYLSFFVLGIIGYRRNWAETLRDSRGIFGFAVAAAAGVFFLPLAFSGKMFSLAVGPALGNAMGNGHWQSALYALWDSIFATGMVLALASFFRRFVNNDGAFGKFLSRQSYVVYIIHTPVLVYLAYLLRNMNLDSLVKFGVVSLITVPVCFGLAYAIRRIPGASRVL